MKWQHLKLAAIAALAVFGLAANAQAAEVKNQDQPIVSSASIQKCSVADQAGTQPVITDSQPAITASHGVTPNGTPLMRMSSPDYIVDLRTPPATVLTHYFSGQQGYAVVGSITMTDIGKTTDRQPVGASVST